MTRTKTVRERPFESRAEVDEYLAGDEVLCLECGRYYSTLGPHLKRVHGIDAREYRSIWKIPAGMALAGVAYRATRSRVAVSMIESGVLTHDHLERAVESAKSAGRGQRVEWELRVQSKRTSEQRPGDAHLIPAQEKRADGRDADLARSRQNSYRRRVMLTTDPMERLIEAALLDAEIEFIPGRGGMTENGLDFYLPRRDLYIEVKRFHSDRIAQQMSRADNIIVAQGERAVRQLAAMIRSWGARPSS